MRVDMNLGDTRLIIAEAQARNVLRNQLAYILATAYWETARTMKPVVEAFWLSEEWRSRNLRYYPWHGRGYVQLTWLANYLRAGKELDLDLTTDPDVVMQPEVAAQILVKGSMHGWFTGKSLPDYITLSRSDFYSARRVINGTDKASEIAEIAEAYDAALRAEGYGMTHPTPPDFTLPPATVAPDPAERPRPWWVVLLSMFK